MKLLIDFSPIKTGGGAQLALNFLNYIQENDIDSCILVSDKFPYINRVSSDSDLIVAPSNYLNRIFFENFTLKKEIVNRSITHVYTFFGPGLPPIRGVKQVVSVAYPIICNDDSPYWSYIPKKEFLKKKLINFFRKRRLSNADYLVFETEIMRKRCTEVLNYNTQKTKVIPPSPTGFLTPIYERNSRNITRFLLLTGLDYHKNIWRLVQALPLIKAKCLPVKFLISCTKSDLREKLNIYIKDIDDRLIDDFFEFKGNISSDKIQSVYNESDVMLNISDLESFSNNYMESWRARIPILASDTDFARHICGESAIYVNPHDLLALTNAIAMFIDSSLNIEIMMSVGDEKLNLLPSLDVRLDTLLDIMRL